MGVSAGGGQTEEAMVVLRLFRSRFQIELDVRVIPVSFHVYLYDSLTLALPCALAKRRRSLLILLGSLGLLGKTEYEDTLPSDSTCGQKGFNVWWREQRRSWEKGSMR